MQQGLSVALGIASPAAVVSIFSWQLMGSQSGCVHHSIVSTYISTYIVTCAESYGIKAPCMVC